MNPGDSHTLHPQPDPREEKFRERLQLQIYSWIQKEIPSWQPERSPKYLRSSQALSARLPGKEKASSGLVYFKNVFDPCWSEEDLARLQRVDYPWMLMILSPCERFYEFEPRFSEIVARLHKLILWRPDAPSRAEFENLRKLLFEPSSADVSKESTIYTTNPGVHQILNQLYVSRGQLMTGSERLIIGREIENNSLGYYISDRLAAIAPKGRTSAASKESAPAGVTTESQALHWAELLTGRPEIQDGSVEHARAQLIEWMDSIEEFFKKLPEFPEAFMTIRFARDLNSIKGVVQILKPVLYSLRTSAFTLRESMDHIARNFASDEKRLMKWRQSLDNLGGLARWIPVFLHARDYLRTAYPLGQEKIDRLREGLLKSIDEPYQFLETKARTDFDANYFEFKRNYVDCYCTLHENSHRINDEKNEDNRIDPVALRNLDLLSELQYTDKIYLNRVNILAKWVQRNQCNMPVLNILERYPRCYCNFNPVGNQQPAGMGSQINTVIQEGIDYFRTLLKDNKDLILEELKMHDVDETTLRQITMLVGENPLSALKPQSIDFLNKFIWKYPSEFLASVRNYTPPKNN
jgi:hypothetical protein